MHVVKSCGGVNVLSEGLKQDGASYRETRLGRVPLYVLYCGQIVTQIVSKLLDMKCSSAIICSGSSNVLF